MKQMGKFLLLTKEEFKEWLSKQKIYRKVNVIQNHHTWKPDYKSFTGSNHFTMLKNMENFHVKERKFNQIAQNITTFPDGTIAICRNLNLSPAGIYGHNANGICIEHIGNFDIGGDKMTDAHKETIIFLNAELCKYFRLKPTKETVVYHAWFHASTGKRDNENALKKDAYHKTCAGTNFFGGNSVKSAMENFYPLIEKAMTLLPQNPLLTVVLQKGSKGANVITLQKYLLELGYDLGRYGADGDFGNTTKSQVLLFQKNNNLLQTGIVDTKTWKKILEMCAVK